MLSDGQSDKQSWQTTSLCFTDGLVPAESSFCSTKTANSDTKYHQLYSDTESFRKVGHMEATFFSLHKVC